MMYEFTDITGEGQASALPAEAICFNGHWLDSEIDGFRTLFVEGRESLVGEVLETSTKLLDGSRFRSRRYEPRTIMVTFLLTADSASELMTKWNTLNGILSEEQAQIIFADEPDKYFVGTKVSISEVDPGKLSAKGRIEFYCADPFKYSTREILVTPQDGVFVVDYKGTVPAYPVLTATAAGDTGFFGYVDAERHIIQIGDPDEVDDEDQPRSETLLSNNFTKEAILPGWQANIATTIRMNREHKKTGTITKNSEGAYASSYGTGNEWHGPSLTYVLPEDSAGDVGAVNGELSWFHYFSTSSYDNIGNVWFTIDGYDSNNDRTNIAAVCYHKPAAGNNKGICQLIIQGAVKRDIEFDLSFWNTITGRPNSVPGWPAQKNKGAGRSSIRKFGSKITFNIAGTVYEYTVPAVTDMQIREVSFWLAGFGTKQNMGANIAKSIKFVKHDVTNYVDVPNKFGEGDEVTADCGAGEIRVNGVVQNGLGALGNDWETFRLIPGINQIQCTWSDWADAPEFVLAYREAYL